jgi:translation initiation factor IF-1
MPGKNNASAAKGKGMNRKSQYAKTANDKVLSEMVSEGIDEKSMRFAKVIKICGNSRVLVQLSDGRQTNALIRSVLRGKQATPIKTDTILLIGLPNWQKDAAAAAAGSTVEPEAYVEAVVDKKTARHFVGLRLIPPAFLVDGGDSDKGDAGFEFGSEDEEEPPKPAEEEAPAAVGGAGIGNSVVQKWNGIRGKEVEDSGFDFFSS